MKIANFKTSVLKTAAVAGLFCLASINLANAAITYEGTLTLGTAVTGSVGYHGWYDEIASKVDFWQFSGNAGDVVDIVGRRLDGALDPAFSLYQGVLSAGTADSNYKSFNDFGGLIYLVQAEDDLAPAVPGPYGDPKLSSYVLPTTGYYTIAIGDANGNGIDGNSYGYNLTVSTSAVPVPGAVWLLGSGLLGLAGVARKKTVSA